MPDAENIFHTPAPRLAQLVALSETEDRKGPWLSVELGAVLRHQLNAPIRSQAAVSAETKPGESSQPAPIRTLRELFHDPLPSLDLLKQTKDFAKANCEHPASPLPKGVATVLYYASIVAALLRHGQRITSLDDSSLRKGIEWVLAQPWLDASMRSLFEDGLRVLGGFRISSDNAPNA